MERAVQALTQLQASWIELKTQRPSESDFSGFGYSGLWFSTIDQLMRTWLEDVNALSAKLKWIETPEALVADATVESQAKELKGLVDAAKSNGVGWLLQANFLQRSSDITTRIASIADRKTSIARAIAREMDAKGLDEMKAIRTAAAQAREVPELREQMRALVKQLETAEEKAATGVGTIESAASELGGARSEIDEAHTFATEKRGEVSDLFDEVTDFRDQAEKKLGDLEKRVTDLVAKVTSATSLNDDATKLMRDALAGVRRQGLAGAFNDRGQKIFVERGVWALVFVAAICYLAWQAQVFALDLQGFSYEALSVALLRRLALAAPAVWVGWYAARQVARLGRIQEDYEYKAATALAFQSYKNEVDASGDDALVSELLQTAIRTFGENPVRHYEKTPHDAVTPTDELIRRLEGDDGFKLLKWVKSNVGLGSGT